MFSIFLWGESILGAYCIQAKGSMGIFLGVTLTEGEDWQSHTRYTVYEMGIFVHWSPAPWSFTSELRLFKKTGTGWLKLPKYWVVSFTDTSKHSIYVETWSLCMCVRHWWRGYYLYASVLLGASTTMTTPCVWHSITHNTWNCWYVEILLLFTMLKTTPVHMNYGSQWNSDFALPVPASLVSGKWWEPKDRGNQCSTFVADILNL